MEDIGAKDGEPSDHAGQIPSRLEHTTDVSDDARAPRETPPRASDVDVSQLHPFLVRKRVEQHLRPRRDPTRRRGDG